MFTPRMRARIVAPLLLTALVAAGCGGDDDDGDDVGQDRPEATGGSFSMYLGEPEHLVPTNTNESEGSQVLDALFTGLISYDEDNKPVNEVADSIESEDQITWTVKLKEGWTFHDGTPVDAQSFVDAWNYGAYAPNAQGNSYFFDKIEGYEALNPKDPDGDGPAKAPTPATKTMSGLKVVSPTEFTVKLTSPFSQFPLTLGYTALYPMPKVAFTDIKKYEEAPVGNGPYQMDGTWTHNQSIKVKKYPDYKGDEGNADNIEFKIYSDLNTGYLDAQAGNVDIVDTVPPEKIASAPQEFSGRFIEASSSSWTYMGFPTYDRRFQNPELRRALSMAIDRDSITKVIFSGTRSPARSIVSPVVPGFREDACGEGCQYDPAKAKELFTKAGGYSGTLEVWFNSGAGHEKWVEAVANNWRTNLGLTNVKFRTLDFAQYLPLLDAKKITGPFRLGWVMDYPSPQNYLEPIFGTNGSSNNFGYSNPEVDKLIAEGNEAKDLESGIDSYQKAEDLILADMPAIPMFFGKVQGVHSEKVENVTIDSFTRVRLADVRVKS